MKIFFYRIFILLLMEYSYFDFQFGQVGVGDNVDHCSPVQVKFPEEQAMAF